MSDGSEAAHTSETMAATTPVTIIAKPSYRCQNCAAVISKPGHKCARREVGTPCF